MTIRVLPNRIPIIWEAIKFSSVKADGVREKDIPIYLTNLLHALLSERAQCFVNLDDERRLVRIAITRVKVDEVTGEKSLAVNSLYGFKPTSVEEWQRDIDTIKDYAKKHGCKRVLACSNNERVFEIVQNVGFENYFRHFVLEV